MKSNFQSKLFAMLARAGYFSQRKKQPAPPIAGRRRLAPAFGPATYCCRDAFIGAMLRNDFPAAFVYHREVARRRGCTLEPRLERKFQRMALRHDLG